MVQILQLLQELVAACNGLRLVAQAILDRVAHVAQENVPFHIATQVDITQAVVTDATFGNQQINANVLAVITDLTAGFDALSAQIAAFSPTGTTVNVTPLGSGDINSALLNDIAEQVWIFPDPITSNAMIDNVMNTWAVAANTQAFTDTMDNFSLAPWVLLNSDDPRSIIAGSDGLTTLDYSTILSSDATAVDWVNRIFGDTLAFDIGNGVPGFISDSGHSYYIPTLDTYQFATVKAWATGQQRLVSPPVWPGIDNVVLGTPLPISLTFTVDGPLDGVLVHLDTYPALKGQYVYDDMTQALKIGALTFVDDDGQAEYIQSLGFLDEIYVPKNMVRAASCKVRTVSGVTGTVTPWTIA